MVLIFALPVTIILCLHASVMVGAQCPAHEQARDLLDKAATVLEREGFQSEKAGKGPFEMTFATNVSVAGANPTSLYADAMIGHVSPRRPPPAALIISPFIPHFVPCAPGLATALSVSQGPTVVTITVVYVCL